MQNSAALNKLGCSSVSNSQLLPHEPIC